LIRLPPGENASIGALLGVGVDLLGVGVDLLGVGVDLPDIGVDIVYLRELDMGAGT
jgi:hypothetical protein